MYNIIYYIVHLYRMDRVGRFGISHPFSRLQRAHIYFNINIYAIPARGPSLAKGLHSLVSIIIIFGVPFNPVHGSTVCIRLSRLVIYEYTSIIIIIFIVCIIFKYITLWIRPSPIQCFVHLCLANETQVNICD